MAALDEALLQLVREQLIREYSGASGPTADQPPDRMFIFEHQLTLEAAYGGLLQRKRRALHRRVAEAWERLYPEQISAQLSLLAYHWEHAGNLEWAVHYLKRAGEQAASQYANVEAIGHFTRALQLLPEGDLASRYDLLLSRERAYDLLGDRDAAGHDLDLLQGIAEALGSLPRQAEVALQRARRHLRLGQTGDAIDDLYRAVGGPGKVQDTVVIARGQVDSYQSYDELERYERAAGIAHAAGAQYIEGLALREYGLQLLLAGRHTQAVAVLEQGLNVCRAAGDLAGEANILNVLALQSLHAGNYERALGLVDRGLKLERDVGNRYDEGYGLHTLGWIYAALGRYAEAEAALKSAAALLREVRAPLGVAFALAAQGELLTDLGLYAAARSAYQETITTVTAANPEMYDAYPLLQAWAGLALISCLEGKPDGARAYGQKVLTALDIPGELQEGLKPFMRVRAWLALGRAHLELAELEAAQAAYQNALGVVEDPEVRLIQRPNLALDVRESLAAVAMAREAPAEALSYIEPMIDQLLDGAIDGALEPTQVYLTSVRVLEAVGDPRAPKILRAGYRFLQRRAATITDEATRDSYLTNVVANREILALYELGTSTSHPV